MTKDPNEAVHVGEALDVIRKTAQTILNNPDSITVNNYQDVFEILEKGYPEKFTKEYKNSILRKLGLPET
jgi:hypothetical protein